MLADSLRATNLEAKLWNRIKALFTEHLKCARPYAVSLFYSHYLLHLVRKILSSHWLHNGFATESFQSTLNTDCKLFFGSHDWPAVLWGKKRNCHDHRHCRHTLSLEWWKTDDNLQVRVTIPQGAGQGKTTLKCDQMTLFTLLDTIFE